MEKSTKDIENAFGINRKTLFFYEEEGLLHPQRKENGYRVYHDDDIERLKMILLLRGMDVSLDDVKKYLNKEITVQEILRKQSEKLHAKKEEYAKKEQEALYLKDREMPLLDYGELLDVKQARGRRIALCQRKHKKEYSKALRNALIFSVLILSVIIIGYNSATVISTLPLHLYLIPVFLFVIVYFLNVIHQESYLEFTDKGIYYYQSGRTKDDLRHFLATLKGNEEEGVCFASYENVNTIHIQTRREYVKYWHVGLPEEIYTYSITFELNGGRKFVLYNPYTMEKDQGLFAFVLLSKVKNIDDPHGALEAMANGQSLTAHMKMQNA